jgi:hypothetical protein
VNPGSSATRSMHVAVALIVTGAVIFMAGVLAALVGEAVRLTSPHVGSAAVRPPAVVWIGAIAAASGLVLGLGTLLLVLPGVTAVRAPGPRWSGARRSGPRRSGPRIEDARPHRDSWDSWDNGRQDSAEDWLRPLRAGHAMGSASPERAPGQERGQASDWIAGYADDGWHPDFLPGQQGRHATGPLPAVRLGPDTAPLGPGTAPLSPVPGEDATSAGGTAAIAGGQQNATPGRRTRPGWSRSASSTWQLRRSGPPPPRISRS